MASRAASVLRVIPRPRASTSSVHPSNSSSCNPLQPIPHRCIASCSRYRSLATASTTSSELKTPHPPPASSTSADPKIGRIVDDISGLTLLQAADLVSLLKSRLNIQEVAMPMAAAAPVAQATPDEEAQEEKPKEKTIFNVKLESFDAAAKPKIIREVKALVPNLTLMDAKKFVESVPKVLKENLPKEDAEKLKKVFTDLGGVVTLE